MLGRRGAPMHQVRPAAQDSPQAEAVKVLARTHKTLIWERTQAVQRLRHQLQEYFPTAVAAFRPVRPRARRASSGLCVER